MSFAAVGLPLARSTPVVGLTTNNQLVRFDSATPGTLAGTVSISGLLPAETILAIDYQPLRLALYGLGSSNRLYTIDPETGVATVVGSGFSPALNGTAFGFDFNPVVNRIRVVSDAEQNFRLNPDTGATVFTDTSLTYGSAVDPSLTAVAYDKNISYGTNTTLYGIDTSLDVLVRQGGINGLPSPNGGQLTSIGPLNVDATGDASLAGC